MTIFETHSAIIGASGAGKTTTARGQAEALLSDGRHVCIIDPTGGWFGLRSNVTGDGPGFDIPIFGGAHGDVPVTADQGEAIGAIIADGVSAIIDLSGLRTGSEQRRFVRDLLRRLRRKPDGNFHLIVDEADEFAAQKPRDDYGFQVGEELIWMAKRGRLAGFVLTLITQRPASIDKEVLTQAQTLIVHQLVAPVDQKPVIDYLRDNADKATLAAIKGSLASLGRGERWIYAPRAGVLERGFTDMPTTFDSSRTPLPGETRVEPKMLAQIDLGAIREALQPVEESFAENANESGAHGQIAENANCLRCAELSAEIGRLECAHGSEKATWLKRQNHLLTRMVEAVKILDAEIPNGEVGVEAGEADGPATILPKIDPEKERQVTAIREKSMPRRSLNEQLVNEALAAGQSTSPLNASAIKMLVMLDRIAPARVTWTNLAAMIGNKARGGNFNAARKAMRESGHIIEDGETIRSANPPASGMTRREVIALWCDVLQNPAPRMINALQAEPMGLTKVQLGETLGIAPRGGNFNHGVAQMIRNGIAVDRGGVLTLAVPLPGEAA